MMTASVHFRPLMGALLLAALPGMAAAVEYNTVQAEKSSIRFVAKQMGVPVSGEFSRFNARITFDPARPEAAQAQIDVDLASIETGSAEANTEVKGKAWFNIAKVPAASFVSGQLKALGNGRYEAAGKMSIKGYTRDITASFTAKREGANMVLDGSFPLQRLQYNIGEGAWADTATVADEVQVRVHFVLGSPATPRSEPTKPLVKQRKP